MVIAPKIFQLHIHDSSPIASFIKIYLRMKSLSSKRISWISLIGAELSKTEGHASILDARIRAEWGLSRDLGAQSEHGLLTKYVSCASTLPSDVAEPILDIVAERDQIALALVGQKLAQVLHENERVVVGLNVPVEVCVPLWNVHNGRVDFVR